MQDGAPSGGHGGSPPLTPLIGRGGDVQKLERILPLHRLVTVVGAGGIGKTAICAHVARSRAGHGAEVAWIDLTPVGPGGGVFTAIARAMAHAPAEPVDQEQLELAVSRRDDVLLVVDNCEHVLEELVPIAERLLRMCPRARLLATSRVPIGIAGEVTWRLGPLAMPNDAELDPRDLERFGATALFVERARQALPNLVVGTADAGEIGALCRWLDGNPLAVMIAAAQVRWLPLAELRASLRRSNRLLKVDAAGERSGRHDVEDSIRWSHDLLDDASRGVLRTLAAIPGDFELDLACQVAADATRPVDDVLAGVRRLVDHGLVEFDGRRRYRLTFVVRHFVVALPDPLGELAVARERHARTVIDWATDQTRWGRAVRPQSLDERATDVHAAIAWAMVHDRELACRAFADFGVMLHGATHARYCAWLIEQTERGPMWARAVGWLAVLAPPAAHASIAGVMPDAITVATQAGDDHALRLLACTPTYMAMIGCDLRSARELVRSARAAGDGWIVVATATTAAMISASMGRKEDAVDFGRAVRWACEQGGLDHRSTASTIADAVLLHTGGAVIEAEAVLDTVIGHGRLGVSLLHVRTAHALDRADADTLRLVIATIGRSDDLGEQTVARHAEIALCVIDGDWAATTRLTTELIGRGAAYDIDLALVRAAAAENALDQERADLALADVARRIDQLPEPAPLFASRSSILHARAALRRGQIDGAQQHATGALVVARSHGLRLVQIDALDAVAAIAAARGNRRQAERLRGAADAARDQVGYPSRLFAGARPGDRSDDEYDDGRRLALSDAVALALRMRGARRRPAFGIESLTPTERAIAQFVAAGCTNADIAAQMLISAATVKTHLTRTFAKLGVTNRTQLARLVSPVDT